MFELLLQADKSMSDGLLDQAERTYWQLIELDPTNSIAVSELARISLQRGDERLARTLADRALGIDPESIAARRVIQALDEGASTPSGPSATDPQLKGAERLEALSRRRAAGDEAEEGAAPPGAAKGSARPRIADRSPRGGGAGPDKLQPMPAEPLHERRREGRLAAAAAAAAATAREPGHARHEPHRAMPSGRHLFRPEMLKAPASDPFSEAEMAAAVAAVDSLDDALEAPEIEAPAQAAAPPDFAHVLEAVDATDARDSVALRIALLPTPVEPPEPEAPAEQAGVRSPQMARSPADEAPADAWWTVAEQATGRPVRGAEPDRVGPSEADAEVEALREAVGIVTADPGQAGPTEGSVSGGEVGAEASVPRKKGLFGRFRGS